MSSDITCPKTGRPLPYSGGYAPKWVTDGAKVRVKVTSTTRVSTRGSTGLRVANRFDSRDVAAWGGEVGTVKCDLRPHPTQAEVDAGGCWFGGVPYVAGEGGWWRWVVEFDRGRTYYPTTEEEWAVLLRHRSVQEWTEMTPEEWENRKKDG